ncbi:hypothetical protein GOBAR_DD24183 [Gossypium barbadense]|nr:hypothetical protein GOBAR_DD24183 [Gossypium barbadense]
MDERMIQAAQTGDINLLYELILNDPYVLQRIDDVPFFHTPVHVAASAGHIEFMMEMIKLKPTFARKLNQAGFSPMHLALQNDRTHAVLRLLRFDEGLVRVKGREDLTPLHHVVQTGNVDLLIKLLAVCPEAIEDVTVRDLAVKNDMFEAFQVLVGWLIRSRYGAAQRWEKELLSWADIDGNTVLHIAAIRHRPRVMEVLLEHLHPYQINAKNLEGLTALDIQSQYPWNERQADRTIDMLSKAGGLSGSSSSLPNTSTSSFHIDSLKEKMTCPFKNYQFSLSQDQPLNSHTFLHKTDINTAPMPSPSAIDVFIKDEWSSEYSSFWAYNSLTFWAAVFLTAILLPPHSFCTLVDTPSTYRVWEILHAFSCCFDVVTGTITICQ